MIKFTVTPDGADAYDIEAGSRDVLRWERSAKGRSFGDLAESIAMGDMYTLAYFASVRTGDFEGKQAEFEAIHEISIAEEPAPDPTP